MDSSLSPLDNLSTSSDEIELVKAVYDYLADRQYPEKCTKNQKRTIRRKASQFEVADGEREGEYSLVCELLTLCLAIFKEVKLRYIMNKDEQTKILN